jgi:hypothetical protein
MQKLSRTVLLLLILISFSSQNLMAQQFELHEGSITLTKSDSRSINFLDYNNDGWQDIYISNGPSGGQKDFLYRNNGAGSFIKVTNMEIVQASNSSDGASFADYNNDGHVDGMVVSWYGEEDLLYLNNGNATLNYNGNAGITPSSFAETATFGDYDNDGWLDLYVTHSSGDKRNALYRNLKNGKFEQISNHILVNDSDLSRGAIWGDFNNDRNLDLFVTNEESTKNDMFLGDGKGNYTKFTSGNIVNSSKSSMTGSWGDIDNDGDMDLFVGNSKFFAGEKNQLFKNNGGSFTEISNDPIVSDTKCTFGSAFADYDNDGDLDLAVSNGFCDGGMANSLYENQGDGSFIEVSNLIPSNGNICSFGLAWGDTNNDGFQDLMIANCKNSPQHTEQENTLLINLGNENNWLKIKLTGLQSNLDGIGAKVKVKAIINGEEVWQYREISAQTGYAGQNSLVSHFGLGDATQADSIVVEWPFGGSDTFGPTEINQLINVTESFTSGTNEHKFIKNIQLKIFPNPITKENLNIQLSIQSEQSFQKAEIVLFDSLGQLILVKPVALNPGKTSVIIQLAQYSIVPGIYQISLRVNGQIINEKLVISS